jgi:hypothetical protein
MPVRAQTPTGAIASLGDVASARLALASPNGQGAATRLVVCLPQMATEDELDAYSRGDPGAREAFEAQRQAASDIVVDRLRPVMEKEGLTLWTSVSESECFAMAATGIASVVVLNPARELVEDDPESTWFAALGDTVRWNEVVDGELRPLASDDGSPSASLETPDFAEAEPPSYEAILDHLLATVPQESGSYASLSNYERLLLADAALRGQCERAYAVAADFGDIDRDAFLAEAAEAAQARADPAAPTFLVTMTYPVGVYDTEGAFFEFAPFAHGSTRMLDIPPPERIRSPECTRVSSATGLSRGFTLYAVNGSGLGEGIHRLPMPVDAAEARREAAFESASEIEKMGLDGMRRVRGDEWWAQEVEKLKRFPVTLEALVTPVVDEDAPGGSLGDVSVRILTARVLDPATGDVLHVYGPEVFPPPDR